MPDTLTTKLTEVGLNALDFANKTAKEILQFVQVQAPDILHQWIMWNLWESLLWSVLGGLIFIGSIFGFYKLFTTPHPNFEDDTEFLIFTILLILFLLSVTLFGYNLDWLKILIAEKLWILENIKELVK